MNTEILSKRATPLHSMRVSGILSMPDCHVDFWKGIQILAAQHLRTFTATKSGRTESIPVDWYESLTYGEEVVTHKLAVICMNIRNLCPTVYSHMCVPLLLECVPIQHSHSFSQVFRCCARVRAHIKLHSPRECGKTGGLLLWVHTELRKVRTHTHKNRLQ